MGFAVPLCRWPFPRLCGFPTPGCVSYSQTTHTALSSGFAFLQSLAQQHLACRPQPAGSSHGLFFPSAHQGSEVHGSRAFQARSVPPSGFDYPLDGLLPPSPCRPFFTPAALLGFTLRSFLLPKGIHGVSARMNPPTVSPAAALTACTANRAGRPRFLGFHPFESPWRPERG